MGPFPGIEHHTYSDLFLQLWKIGFILANLKVYSGSFEE